MAGLILVAEISKIVLAAYPFKLLGFIIYSIVIVEGKKTEIQVYLCEVWNAKRR